MALDEILAEAFINRPHRVLGRRLRPFCSWHVLQLEAMESPFLVGGPVQVADLDRATAICQCRFGEVRLEVGPLWKIFWHIAAGGFERECEKFEKYRKDFFSPPRYDVVQTQAQLHAPPPMPLGRSPEVFDRVATVMGWLKCGRREAWEMPIGELRWYEAKAHEASGATLDFEDAARRKFHEECEADDDAPEPPESLT